MSRKRGICSFFLLQSPLRSLRSHRGYHFLGADIPRNRLGAKTSITRGRNGRLNQVESLNLTDDITNEAGQFCLFVLFVFNLF